jgi:hypothetical protein
MADNYEYDNKLSVSTICGKFFYEIRTSQVFRKEGS